VRFTVEGDEVVARTSVDARFEGFPGHLHGGIISALLDETAGWACTVASGRLYYTVQLTVRYSRPVPGGQPIVIRGRCSGDDGRIARGQAAIEDAGGRCLATAEGRFFPLPREQQEAIVPHLKMAGRPARIEDL
jgi:uncharacterized protein (TIGR00369 family)